MSNTTHSQNKLDSTTTQLVVRLLASKTIHVGQYGLQLAEVSRLLPPACQVVLLAGRGFVDVYLVQLVVHLGWHLSTPR